MEKIYQSLCNDNHQIYIHVILPVSTHVSTQTEMQFLREGEYYLFSTLKIRQFILFCHIFIDFMINSLKAT